MGYITLSKTRIWAVLRVMKLFDEQFMTRKINFWKKKKRTSPKFLANLATIQALEKFPIALF